MVGVHLDWIQNFKFLLKELIYIIKLLTNEKNKFIIITPFLCRTNGSLACKIPSAS